MYAPFFPPCDGLTNITCIEKKEGWSAFTSYSVKRHIKSPMQTTVIKRGLVMFTLKADVKDQIFVKHFGLLFSSCQVALLFPNPGTTVFDVK